MRIVPGLGTRDSGIGHLVAAVLVALSTFASPADAQGRVVAYVAARPLTRGQVIASEDVKTIGGVPLGARSPSPAPRAPVVGWIARRVIAPGEPLRAPSIAPPNVIESGQPVAVVWREPGIEVRLKGVAANAAAMGDRVTVRVDVRRRLEGVAVAPGLVQIQ